MSQAVPSVSDAGMTVALGGSATGWGLAWGWALIPGRSRRRDARPKGRPDRATQELQGGTAVPGVTHVVAGVAQETHGERAQHVVVLHDEDPFVATPLPGPVEGLGRGGRRLVALWQDERHGGAVAGLAVQAHA